MGAKHNLPSLKNAVMDSPNWENFDRGGGGGGVVVVEVKGFFIVLISSLCTKSTHLSQKSF